MKKLSKFAVTLLTLISFSFSGVDEDENKIIHTTKFSPALVEYAANGNHIAQNTLGIVYLKGLGTDADVSKAVYWFICRPREATVAACVIWVLAI